MTWQKPLKENTFYRVCGQFAQPTFHFNNGDIIYIKDMIYKYYSDFTHSKVYSVTLISSDAKNYEFEHHSKSLHVLEEII
jgi:hypothetical protein